MGSEGSKTPPFPSVIGDVHHVVLVRSQTLTSQPRVQRECRLGKEIRLGLVRWGRGDFRTSLKSTKSSEGGFHFHLGDQMCVVRERIRGVVGNDIRISAGPWCAGSQHIRID